MNKKLPSIDVIDLKRKLSIDFPYVTFIIEEEKNTHVFKLSKLMGQKYENPIKTSISLKMNEYITENEYEKIKDKMEKSFNKKNLLSIKENDKSKH